MRVFIDASVLFSACYSDRGASFEIFRLCLQGDLQLAISDFVLEEVRRNLAAKSPESLRLFETFRNAANMEVVNPSRAQVIEAAGYTELKDAPVVAAARLAGVDYLVSLDRRHLVDRPEVARRSGLDIVLPETVLHVIRRVDE